MEGLQYLQGELFLSWQSHNYFSQLLVGLEYLNSKVSLAPSAVYLLPTALGGAGVPRFQGEPCPSWKNYVYFPQLLEGLEYLHSNVQGKPTFETIVNVY
jgi:hypothetical protein